MILFFLPAALLVCSCHALSSSANTATFLLHHPSGISVHQSPLISSENVPCGWFTSCNSPKRKRNNSVALSYAATEYQDKKMVGIDPTMATLVSPAILGTPMPTSDDFLLEDQDFLKALEAAQDADRKYGICSEPSKAAWRTVDSLYEQKLAIDA